MIDDVSKTVITNLGKLGNHRSVRDACLVHIYPTGTNMGRRYSLVDTILVIGRGDDCALKIQDNSVSRRHAVIEPTTQGYMISDCGSTNGTFVNDALVSIPRALQDGDYVRVGNCLYRFLTGSNIELHYHEEIYRLTIIDALTETFNVRYFNEFLDREILRSQRHHRPLALLMFDIDKFKTFNDSHGHLCGDFVLREMCRRVREVSRKEDLFARYGGEEFACVLVETQLIDAIEVAERIRIAIQDSVFLYEGQQLKITISIGIAVTTGLPPVAAAELIEQADQNLYLAKEQGRNRTVSALPV
jgi:two-component system, cell cycle response regulator